MRTKILLAFALVLVMFGTGCEFRRQVRGVETSSLDRTLTRFSFIEEGDLVTLIVDVKTTQYHEERPFIPFEIAVANRGLKTLSLTRESFTLIDEEGNRYHCASPRDLIDGYEFLDWDRDLAELEGILVEGKFAAFVRYPSKFSPTRLASPRTTTPRVVQDRVTLPKFGYLIDFIYFPTPESGVRERRFELHLEAPELPNPVFVKFAVP